MCLDRMLRELAALGDLPPFLSALGQQPLWEELAPDHALLAGAGPVRQAATVARHGSFLWLGLATAEPVPVVRRVTRRLARAGRLAAVVGFYPEGRRMAIAVAFDALPLLELDLRVTDPVALACLGQLRPVPGGPLAYAAQVARALAGRGTGPAFFAHFRIALERMTAALPTAVPTADRHALALLQLTRVLFLYFIQSKGWLDGRPDFLASTVDRCLVRRRRIQRDLLRPLFFGTLNRPEGERSAASAHLGRIPFLNGGLFEPHALERRWPADVPNNVWRDAFDMLFERYHFTAREAGGGEAVAPDMLGRVFEGVMDPADRSETGTFYTPSALVTRMVDAGLAALVASRLRCSDGEAAAQIAGGRPEARRILRGAAILDPAVGSGAFLLGALERLSSWVSPGARRAAARRTILARNLFGVDRNPMAVRLTELRLWLAVVADEPDGADPALAPLPNLDCLVRQGDSLLQPFAVPAGQPPGAADVGRLRARAVTAYGDEKRASIRALRRAEATAATDLLGTAARRAEAAVREMLAGARAPTLFGDPPRLDAAGRRRLLAGRAELRAIRAAARRLARDGELPWFQYESQFADVFARGGFDLVIGNPPWVRAEALPVRVREHLAERYLWWRGTGGHGFGHRPDLSVAFLERAHGLTAPGGAIAMLVPAKLATAGYAARARAALASQTSLHAVADLGGDADASFDATAYPLALIATRRSPPARHQVRLVLDPAAALLVPQQTLSGAPWVLRSGGAAAVARRLAAAFPPLGERFRCRLGVKTGANAIFLDPSDEIEPELLRPVVRGRDLRRFTAEPRHRLLWTHDAHGRPRERLPPHAAAYLARHDSALRARADFRGGVPWQLFRTRGALTPHRVVWGDLSRRLAAVALTGTALDGTALDGTALEAIVALNTCYVTDAATEAEAHALTGWLNTTWVAALAALVASSAAGGFRRHDAATIAGLPLPPAAIADGALAAAAREAAARGAPAALDRELDDIAAAHLDLSPHDRRQLGDVLATRDRR